MMRGVADWVLPPRCLCCGAMTCGAVGLCGPCFMKMRFLSEPFCCDRCGLPLPVVETVEIRRLCPSCAAHRPSYRRARSVLIYDEVSKPMILAFKHADRTDAAPPFARWLARVAAEHWPPESAERAQMIVPVPLHPQRLRSRRYNQAALLSGRLARAMGIAHRPLVLRRCRATDPQSSGQRRRDNVRGAFAVAQPVAGQRILLVDDVMTTGSTVSECSDVLLAAGAASVDVLTLARAMLAEDRQRAGL